MTGSRFADEISMQTTCSVRRGAVPLPAALVKGDTKEPANCFEQPTNDERDGQSDQQDREAH